MTDRGGKIYCQPLEAQRIQGVTDNRGCPSPMPIDNTHRAIHMRDEKQFFLR